MTRFARAKGSKSSNERLPNEATPWHVMKQNLETALESEQNTRQKTKSAKELLQEKDEPFYSKSLGNINNDWAEFENKEQSKSTDSVKKSKVGKSKEISVNKLKKAVENIQKADKNTVTELVKQVNIENPLNNSDKREENQNCIIKSENEVKTNNFKSVKKDKKIRLDKKEKLKSSVNNNSNSANTLETDKRNVEVLTKRQKRNMKKRKRIEDSDVNKIGECADDREFNVKDIEPNNKKVFEEEGNTTIQNEEQGAPKKSRVFDKSSRHEKNGNSYPDKFNKFTSNNSPYKHKKLAKVRDDKFHPRRKPDIGPQKLTINGVELELVKYDGFPVRKEDADRLRELRQQMVLKGIPKSEIDAAMKLERRKAEKALARIRKQVCFHCRKAGHNLSDCPELREEELGTGICFKCGSTEHTHYECKVYKSDEYRHAKCFICREQGHIAKQCPDNPKGLYPDGGSCKICGEVTHLKKDCPDLVKEKEETAITLKTINDSNLESIDEDKSIAVSKTESKKKIVKF